MAKLSHYKLLKIYWGCNLCFINLKHIYIKIHLEFFVVFQKVEKGKSKLHHISNVSTALHFLEKRKVISIFMLGSKVW